MPLILTQNEITVSGHDYADELGKTYEYPKRYQTQILEGELFVYYRGRRTASGQTRRQAYLGHGRIGKIEPAPDGRLRCVIEDYVPFPEPLDFKDGTTYPEPGAAAFGKKAGLYFRTGVRIVPKAIYDKIVALGEAGA